jgi:hypothetical protein
LSPRNFLLRVVEPGLSLLPGYMVNDQARVALMAIAGQESNWSARTQGNDGPARGYWQFEPAGVAGVATHPNTMGLLAATLSTLDLAGTSAYAAIQYNDPLACVIARLLLWSDPAALPAVEDASGCWDYYVRNWRPGKPDETRWTAAYATACSAVASGGS